MSMGDVGGIQLVTPLPPLRTGIAQYARDLLTAIDGRWPLRIVPERGSSATGDLPARIIDWNKVDHALPTIVQLGNSEFHRRAFEIGLRTSGIAVLHDVVLHHGLLAVALSERRMPEYWRELWSRYGPDGYEAGNALLRGAPVDAISFPLSERYIEQSTLTIVHNRFAERVVRALAPGAEVMRIPMGIPLPVETGRTEARRALGLPEAAFVVASISHINPNKRLPVVLRAIKRLAARLPETLFVIAGSRSPAVDIERQVRALGLVDRVIVTGYVEDSRARMIAAAADACVNLRYPPAGETSASLLRLLGAGKPVLVTDGAPSEDLPPDVGLRVPVDRLEEEFIADLLFELAQNESMRERAGAAARRFVEQSHSMGAAVEGYRQAIHAAFGIDLPVVGAVTLEEPSPDLDDVGNRPTATSHTFFDRQVAAALDELALGRHEPLLRKVSRGIVELNLDRIPGVADPLAAGDVNRGRTPSERFAQRVVCPCCHGALRWERDGYTCSECGTTWSQAGGVPSFVARSRKRTS